MEAADTSRAEAPAGVVSWALAVPREPEVTSPTTVVVAAAARAIDMWSSVLAKEGGAPTWWCSANSSWMHQRFSVHNLQSITQNLHSVFETSNQELVKSKTLSMN
ncbi:hypothetical protein [Tsukamurella paurometabola]|uniref:Uncharacterized protein n=1 Tax=Tsukamurella paurometabola TaxID=2061 RepID=A0ABS5NIQ5_TSUPA|nr:hypothetical protein [Tsukamurella paurometabola]MBS4104171.1 hypothetical protein [Tsukamurella paurometabola]